MGHTILTLPEVAERYRVSKSFLYKRVESGELPHFRIGRYLRFDADDVDQWFRETYYVQPIKKGV